MNNWLFLSLKNGRGRKINELMQCKSKLSFNTNLYP